MAQPAPDRPLRRRRLRLVDAAPDEVEERRRELVRAGLASLAQERRDERGLGVGRRLLLVLAVVAGPALAADEPEDDGDDEERRDRREAEQQRGRCGRGAPSARRSARGRARSAPRRRAPPRRSASNAVPALDAHAGSSRRTRSAGSSVRSSTNWCGRDVRPRAASRACRRARRRRGPRPDGPTRARIFPGAVSTATRRSRRLGPLVAPDLQVDVDDVVVGDREAAERVARR